ncbi:MAG: dihydrolipoyl dehydrogenase [Candidatus Cloacimonadaceae bacterium]
MEHYKVIVIGGGPGGYETAIRLNQYEIPVALIEKDRIGGVCLNRGCIPTKALVKSVELIREIRESSAYGLPAMEIEPDFAAIFERKNGIVESLVGGIEHLFRKRKIPIISAEATQIQKQESGYRIQLSNGESYTADYVVLATGSRAKSLPGIEIDEVNILSSTGLLELKELPPSLAVVGGGVIGCEFASIFAALGAQVTIIEFLPRILALEDEEIGKRMALAFKKSGIKVLTKVGVSAIEAAGDMQKLILTDESELTAHKVLISVGREPVMDIATKGFDLKRERGAVVIDEIMRSSEKGIYAIGDLNAKLQLAHTASKQGLAVAAHILAQICGKDTPMKPMNYINIPRCTFTNPELASVGYTELQAKEIFGEIKIGKFPFSASGKAMAMSATTGFVKTIAKKDTGEMVGMHIMGPQAAELIAQGAIMISQNLSARDIHDIVFAHPTLSEAIMESVEDLEQLAIHKI